VHKYRNGDKKVAPAKRDPTTQPVKAKPSEIQNRWQRKKDAILADPDIIDYRIDGHYCPSDIVRHATFGLGFIERVLSKTRVEILFQTGLKLMVMNTGVSE
jgi:hypothetical protein